MRLLAAFSLVGLLAGCSGASSQGVVALLTDAGPDQIGAPRGVEDGVDGLVVGHRAMAAGEYEIALRAYHRAAARQGATVDVLSAIGSANLRLGRMQQAEQDLRRALDADGTFVPAHNNLGVALAEQGKWGEAQQHFRLAFAHDAGRSTEIRDNLRLAIENSAAHVHMPQDPHDLVLLRRGQGRYLLLTAPL